MTSELCPVLRLLPGGGGDERGGQLCSMLAQPRKRAVPPMCGALWVLF